MILIRFKILENQRFKVFGLSPAVRWRSLHPGGVFVFFVLKGIQYKSIKDGTPCRIQKSKKSYKMDILG